MLQGLILLEEKIIAKFIPKNSTYREDKVV